MAMEKADAVRAKQEELEDMQRQDEREQREREWCYSQIRV
jgi:hypothetical protein